ncbi:hypothetical protein ABPG75_006055 [Micractinium tetrahymenae]
MLDLFHQLGAAGGNPVSLAGDSHNPWAFELPASNCTTPAAVEFCTASVTPPGLERGLGYVPGVDLADVMVRGMYVSNPQQKYAQIKNRGLVALTANATGVHADFLFVDSIDQEGQFQAFCDAAFDVVAGQPGRLLNATCTPAAQLFYTLGSPDDPLVGYALAQPAAPGLAIATVCNATAAPGGGQEQKQGIVQRVGSAIGGLLG